LKGLCGISGKIFSSQFMLPQKKRHRKLFPPKHDVAETLFPKAASSFDTLFKVLFGTSAVFVLVREALKKAPSRFLDSGHMRFCDTPCRADAALFRDSLGFGKQPLRIHP
jgi:hypothetical protein